MSKLNLLTPNTGCTAKPTYKYLIQTIKQYIHLKKTFTIEQIYDLFCDGDINFHIPDHRINWCWEVIEKLVKYDILLAQEDKDNPDFKMRLNWFITRKRDSFLNEYAYDYVCLHNMIGMLKMKYGFRF